MSVYSKSSKQRRILRVRSKVKGTSARPRLSVFRSNRYLYAQIIDDSKGVTLVSVSDFDLKTDETKSKKKIQENRMEKADKIGRLLAKKAIDIKIKKIRFDRGSSAYLGRVKALAEGAREGGLEF